MYGYTAFIINVRGLSWSPLGEENWPAVRPCVGAIILQQRETS